MVDRELRRQAKSLDFWFDLASIGPEEIQQIEAMRMPEHEPTTRPCRLAVTFAPGFWAEIIKLSDLQQRTRTDVIRDLVAVGLLFTKVARP